MPGFGWRYAGVWVALCRGLGGVMPGVGRRYRGGVGNLGPSDLPFPRRVLVYRPSKADKLSEGFAGDLATCFDRVGVADQIWPDVAANCVYLDTTRFTWIDPAT